MEDPRSGASDGYSLAWGAGEFMEMGFRPAQLWVWLSRFRWIKSTRSGIEGRWRAVREWESRSETWLYPLFETPIWLVGFFGWGYVILRLTWNPLADAESTNLGSVLEAQAAMTAIFLAAMIFIVEAVHRREDLDDPLYEEFLSQSKARWIFSVAVWLTVSTSVLYLLGPISGWLGSVDGPRGDLLGLLSLVIAALIVLAFLLRALHVLRPEEYRRLRREVTLKQVRAGARTFVQESETTIGQVRGIAGIMSGPERLANRAIDRLIERTNQAIAADRVIDIREGTALIDEICAAILAELDDTRYVLPAVGDWQDRRWPNHKAILAGVNRLIRAAKGRATSDALEEIWNSEATFSSSQIWKTFRISESIRNRNELLVQVLLESLLEELHQRKAGEPLPRSGPRIDINDILQHAIWAAFNVNEKDRTDCRRIRMATRVMYTIHEFASYSAFLGDDSATEYAWNFFCDYILIDRMYDQSANGYGIVAPVLPASIKSRGRQAALGLIGYAVAHPNHDLLSKVSERVASLDDALLSLKAFEADASERYGLDSPIGQPRVWMTFAAFGPDKENVIEARSLKFVVLGYMWVLAMRLGIGGKELAWVDMPDEYREAWTNDGTKLVEAIVRCGWGNWQEAEAWCERTFGS